MEREEVQEIQRGGRLYLKFGNVEISYQSIWNLYHAADSGDEMANVRANVPYSIADYFLTKEFLNAGKEIDENRKPGDSIHFSY